MHYKSNYTTRPWTSYKNTREQVVPEVGLVFSIGRESYYIFNVAPPNMVSPPKDTQGFPAYFQAFKVKSVSHIHEDVDVDESVSFLFEYKDSKKKDMYVQDSSLTWGTVFMII